MKNEMFRKSLDPSTFRLAKFGQTVEELGHGARGS